MNNGDAISSVKPTVRPVGSSELSLCKGLQVGTGITAIGLLFSKDHGAPVLQNVLRQLQSAHPVLRSRLRYDPSTKTFSLVTLPAPFIELGLIDLKATSLVLQPDSPSPPLVQIVEHEVNEDKWREIQDPSNNGLDTFCARCYELGDGTRVLALQFLTVALDRTAGNSLLKEFLARLASRGDADSTTQKLNTEIGAALEDLNPKKMAKGLWSSGKSLLSNTVTSVGLNNLCFKDTKSLPRSSRILRMELDRAQTQNLLAGCEKRGIKLHGVTAAAGMIAAHSVNASRNNVNFGVVMVFDCRPSLNPPPPSNFMGFYSTGILTPHPVGKNESLWDLAEKTQKAFTKEKKTNKHLTEIVILNTLFCKAIEHPALTPSSAQRTSLLSVFEDPAIMDGYHSTKELLGLEDFISIAAAHGAGPSITFTDTILDGQLKFTVAYPSPLHSREQLVEIVDKMKNILVDAGR
uniref:Condensation domain-containing protein n=1 Tax=Kalanchoe fedtschenkoi TaxID=63787 RepID=A0A7N0TH80_KALFE